MPFSSSEDTAAPGQSESADSAVANLNKCIFVMLPKRARQDVTCRFALATLTLTLESRSPAAAGANAQAYRDAAKGAPAHAGGAPQVASYRFRP